MNSPILRLSTLIRSRLAVRFFIVVAAAVVLPAALLFITGLTLFEGAVRQSVDVELRSALDRSERDLTQFLADLVVVSGVLANDEEVVKALHSKEPEYERSRQVDRAVATALASVPGRESVRYTIIGDERLYTSWSRNLNDYRFLTSLPIVALAARNAGHLVWDGFSPSFVMEEKGSQSLVSVARAIEPSVGVRGVVILQAEKEAFRSYFRERRASGSFSALLANSSGILVDPADADADPSVLAAIRKIAAAGTAQTTVPAERAGGSIVAARRLTGLPKELRSQGWTLVVLYDYGDMSRRFNRLKALFAPSFIGLLFLALVASYFVTGRVVKPITQLTEKMDSWTPEQAELSRMPDLSRSVSARSDEIGRLDRAFHRLERNVLDLITSLQREHATREQFRFRALSAQLNPHFLFNSLNSLRWMAILRGADNIVDTIDKLSALLAYSTSRDGDRATLDEEIRCAESYLSIQNIRYGGRFTLQVRVAPELRGLLVLRFMLQPLVENCVIHGYRGLSKEGVIEISAAREGRILKIEVADRGAGLIQDLKETVKNRESPELANLTTQTTVLVTENPEKGNTLHSESRSPEEKGFPALHDPGTGIGTGNIRDMLSLLWGEEAKLELLSRPGGGACVRIQLPVDTKGSAG